ncbi:MAG: methyltransferase domain-containing protein [Clostridia bacterium]|nr:methyltransferase domain-containing protein [Clostridia bacterium]
MDFFTCPVCKKRLTKKDRSLICENGHCFDLSKKGYVNLLRPAKSSGVRHGDDKLMVSARTAFLGAGFYDTLRDVVTETVLHYAKESSKILDAGCGEGFYTSHIRGALAEQNPSVYGIDVSKDAIHAAAVRDKQLRLAVASIFDLPVEDRSIDILVNLFAPYDAAEFSRVLKDHGILLRVFPREKHLWELKTAVYDVPYENEIDTLVLEGFDLVEKREITFPLALHTKEYIDTLFKMTPYYYKTSREGQAKLRALDSLQTHAEFLLVVYRKV